MGEPIKQDGRPGTIKTALDDDTFGLVRFDGNEALSELFEYRLEVVSLTKNIDFDDALGQGVTVTIKTADNKDRYFHGLLIEARWAGQRGDLFVYQLIVRPWLHLLSLTSNCRIFSKQSVKEIVNTVFSECGFLFRDDTHGHYPSIEYCVQYRETTFAFVSRMLEKWGVYYYFEHADGAHTLVMADQKSCHTACPDLDTVRYISADQAGRREIQHLEEWTRGRVVESGKFTLNDYNYDTATASMEGERSGSASYTHSDEEMYDYPGGYANRGEGDQLAQVELEAAQSLDDRRTTSGSALSLFPGALVTVQEQDVDDENQEYLVVACSHFFGSQSFRADDQLDDAGYLGSFEFTPSDRQFRAELITPRPAIPGVQSALVVGEDEIDVDQEGRILVQFYWDRQQKQSRRVRVVQGLAGKDRGALYLPRIGDEVLIQYDDGDPDRPVVTGSVYKSDSEVTATLPGHKTVTGLIGKSTSGGSATDNANGWWFDDKGGSEAFVVRARKDLYVRVWGDEHRHVSGDQTEDIDGKIEQNVGKDVDVEVQGEYELEVHKAISIDSLSNIEIESETKITLTVGASSITIDKAEVTIDSPLITLKGGVAVEAKAPLISVKGDALIDLTSSITAVAGGALILTSPTIVTKITWGAAFGAPPIPAPG